MSPKLAGHPIHPMLVGLPIGMLTLSVIFDGIYLATQSPRWSDISFWSLALGILAGLLAAPWGSIDWLKIPSGTRAKRIGLFHGICAVTAIALFAISWFLRYETPTLPPTNAIIFSFVAMAVLAIAGWLGGELVFRLGIGVDRGANPDSSSSLSGAPASESTENRKSKSDQTAA